MKHNMYDGLFDRHQPKAITSGRLLQGKRSATANESEAAIVLAASLLHTKTRSAPRIANSIHWACQIFKFSQSWIED